jgi:hypothetical protein
MAGLDLGSPVCKDARHKNPGAPAVAEVISCVGALRDQRLAIFPDRPSLSHSRIGRRNTNGSGELFAGLRPERRYGPWFESYQRTLSSLYKPNFSSQVTTGIFSHTAWAMIWRSNGSAWCSGRSNR